MLNVDEPQPGSEMAAALGIPAQRFRRELQLMEIAGVAVFKRIGPARLVMPMQVPVVLDWLEKRGLLTEEGVQAILAIVK